MYKTKEYLSFIIVVLSVLIVVSCDSNPAIKLSSGKLGGGVPWVFNCTQQELQEALNEEVENRSNLCDKNGEELWGSIGYGFLNGKVFCLSNESKCYVSILKSISDDENITPYSKLSIRALFYKSKWHRVLDSDDVIMKKIEVRFENEVLKKLRVYKTLSPLSGLSISDSGT